MVQKCREIIDYFQPNVWFIENPDSGLLKTRDVVAGLAKGDWLLGIQGHFLISPLCGVE